MPTPEAAPVPAPAPVVPADLQALPCGWLQLDARGRVQAGNAAVGRLLGVDEGALAGRPFDQLLTPASRMLYQSYLQPLLHLHGHVQELMLALRGADGAPVDVMLYTSRPDGDAASGVQMVLAPVRQRRRIEDELLRIKRAADSSPGMIFQWLQQADGGSVFPYASEAVRTLYGITPEAAARSAEALLSRIDPDDRAALEQALFAAAPAGRMVQLSYRVHLDGAGPRWHELQATPRVLAHGSVLWHGHVADVSVRRALEMAIAERQTADRLHRVSSDFMARVSHELRTPLNGILGFARLLAGEQADNLREQQRDWLAIIQGSGQHLLRLINQVLDVSRIQAGQLEMDLRPCALAEQVARAVRVVQADAAASGVQLLPPAVAPHLAVLCDELRLQQVLLNLLSNAVKYNRAGGTVQVQAEAEADGLVRIDVTDTGIGLSVQQQAGLFQPFNRLGAQAAVADGHGLGLVICKHLVTLMGGRMDVRSRRGAGSTFTAWLPLAAEAAAEALDGHEAGAPAAPAAALERAAAGVRGHVLYVEDDAVNVILMQAIIGTCPGVTLHIAHNGAQALALAARQDLQVLLLDMHLPDMDGIALLAGLRRQPRLRAVPAVMVSAGARADDIERARAHGFTGYWTKPIDVDQALRELRGWLAGSA